MKVKFLLSFIFIFFFFNGFSQNNNLAFAITGQANGNFNWTDIRSLDMSSGTINGLLFEEGKTRFSLRDAETNTIVDQISITGIPTATLRLNGTISAQQIILKNPSPTMLMSAAIAYDKRNDKLFFASMHTGRLMWLDMKSGSEAPAFYTIQKPLIKNDDFNDEALNITRMTIGGDANGYALTNDGNHLIKGF
jgi:hypothetical protein